MADNSSKWWIKKTRRKPYSIDFGDFILAAFILLISIGVIGCVADATGFESLAKVARSVIGFFSI